MYYIYIYMHENYLAVEDNWDGFAGLQRLLV